MQDERRGDASSKRRPRRSAERRSLRIEREPSEKDAAQEEDDDALAENPMRTAARARQFAMIKELLTAPVLGAS